MMVRLGKRKKIFKDSINDSRLSMFDENNGGLVIVTFAKTPTTHLLITEDGWLTSRELHVPKPKNWGIVITLAFIELFALLLKSIWLAFILINTKICFIEQLMLEKLGN